MTNYDPRRRLGQDQLAFGDDAAHQSKRAAAARAAARQYRWTAPDFTQEYPPVRGLDAGVLEGLFSRMTLQIRDLSQQVEALTNRIRHLEDVVEEATDRPAERLVELALLHSSALTLKRPILVNIEEYQDETLARWPVVELTARGSTEPEALRSLTESIEELYFELRETDLETLGEAPKQWLAVLNAAISLTRG